MSGGESAPESAAVPGGPRSAVDAAIDAALARVIGVPAALRDDTPLAALGVDSLARLLIADHCADHGWVVDEVAFARATTVAEAADCLSRDPGSGDALG